MQNSSPFLSVIIPCFNEERNLENGALDEVATYLAAQNYSWQVIIVNDASTDGSRDFVARFVKAKTGFQLLDIPHGGKPMAVWAGIQKAGGDCVLLTDMDQSTPIQELDKLLPWYEQGFDTVIGSRGGTREGFSFLRKTGSFVFRSVRGILLLPNISDTQCGFKLFRRPILLSIFPFLEFLRRKDQSRGWKVTAYDVELLYLIQRAGYRIKEVPVEWYNRDQSTTKSSSRGGTARYLRESFEMAWEIAHVKTNQLQGLYDEVRRAPYK
jgi:dolichyl-phosphate beta-glucosyltransferase